MADERPICPKCHAPMVKGCDGQGYIMTHVPEMADKGLNPECVRQCPNLRAREIAQHLGPLAKIQHVESSPLYQGGPGEEPTVDLTGTNLFITGCRWHNFQPHLKLAVGRKGLTFTFRWFTDERLKNIFVGNEGYKARRQEQAGKEVNNGLRDALGDLDLCIIKVGYLGHKNVAAPGLLKEALLIRASVNRATWILHDPDRPWIHSRDPDVVEMVRSYFTEIEIASDADPGIEPIHPQIIEDDEDDEEDTSLLIAAAQETPGEVRWDDEELEDGGEVDVSQMPELAPDKPKWRKRR